MALASPHRIRLQALGPEAHSGLVLSPPHGTSPRAGQIAALKCISVLTLRERLVHEVPLSHAAMMLTFQTCDKNCIFCCGTHCHDQTAYECNGSACFPRMALKRRHASISLRNILGFGGWVTMVMMRRPSGLSGGLYS